MAWITEKLAIFDHVGAGNEQVTPTWGDASISTNSRCFDYWQPESDPVMASFGNDEFTTNRIAQSRFCGPWPLAPTADGDR